MGGYSGSFGGGGDSHGGGYDGGADRWGGGFQIYLQKKKARAEGNSRRVSILVLAPFPKSFHKNWNKFE